MKTFLLDTIEQVYSAYNDVKNTFDNLENEVDIDSYLQKLFKFGKVFGVYDDIDNRYCGFAAVYMNDLETKTAYISLIGVSSDYKNKHIGTQLLRYVEKQAFDSCMEHMQLEVKKHNNIAIGFYQKNGYSFIEKETTSSWFMIKRLTKQMKNEKIFNRQRIDWLDIAKGIGMLLVIYRHCIDDSFDQLPQLTLMIKSFFMPLFFIISGYLYKLKPTKDYLYSKAKALLIPLVFVYIYNFYTGVLSGGLGVDHAYIKLGGYWFIEALLYITVLYHFLNVFLLNVKFIKTEFVNYIMFAFSVLVSAVALIYCYLYGGNPSINSAAVALGFFSFGHIYRSIEKTVGKKFKSNRIAYLIVGICCLSITFLVSQNLKDLSMAYNKCSNPVLYIICAVLGTLGTIYLSKAINTSKALCFFGRNTLVMLLTQMGIINILRLGIEYISQNVFGISESVKVIIIFISTSFIEVFVVIFFNRVFPIFTGKPRFEQK